MVVERVLNAPPVRASLRPRPFICQKQAFRVQRCHARRAEHCKCEDPAGCSALCSRSGSHPVIGTSADAELAGRPAPRGCSPAQGGGWAGGCRCQLHGALRALCAGISLRKSSRDLEERVREVAGQPVRTPAGANLTAQLSRSVALFKWTWINNIKKK